MRILTCAAIILLTQAPAAWAAEESKPTRPIVVYTWGGPWTGYDLYDDQNELLTKEGDSQTRKWYPTQTSVDELRNCDIAYIVNHGGELVSHPFAFGTHLRDEHFHFVNLKFPTDPDKGPSLVLAWGCENGSDKLIDKYARGLGILPDSPTKVYIAPKQSPSIVVRTFPEEFFKEFGKGDVTAEDAARRAYEKWAKKNFDHPELMKFETEIGIRGNGKLTLNQIRADVTSRPFWIATARDDRNRCNQIVITSSALAELDAKKPVAIRFTLYRSQTAGGPFTEAAGGLMAFADDAIEKDASKPGRIAANQFRLVDSENFRELGLAHAPVYYKVGMRLVQTETMKDGSEVQSPPSRLGKAVVQSRSGGNPPFAGDQGLWMWGTFALALSDQRFDAGPAHFTATVGTWTGHFWSTAPMPPEGAAPGTPPRWRDECSAGIMIPARPFSGDRSVDIKASSGQWSAAGSFKIAGDRQVVDGLRKQIEQLEAELAKDVAERKRRAENLSTLLPHWEQAEAKMTEDGMLFTNGVFTLDELSTQQPDDVKNVTGSGRMNREEVRGRIREMRIKLERYSASDGMEEIGRLEQIARARGDYAGLLNAMRLARQRVKVEHERSARFAAGGAAPSANDPDYLRELMKADSAVQDAAFLAGDAAALIEAGINGIASLLALVEQKQASEREVNGALARLADGIATLTGNQHAAAGVLSKVREIGPSLPAWWPAGRPAPASGGSMTGASLKELETSLQNATTPPSP